MGEMALRKKQMLLGRFAKDYAKKYGITINGNKAFAIAAKKTFDSLGDNPKYEEFEKIMQSNYTA